MSESPPIKVEVKNVCFLYGQNEILKGINLNVYKNKITALIGPSGCGKSTLLRSINRMHDLYPGNHCKGDIILHPDNTNLLDSSVDPIKVRSRVGMILQKPTPFPRSIFENVAYGIRIRGEKNKSVISDLVEESLIQAALWQEVKDRLHTHAWNMSGGQQQRLCIARVLATKPEVLLCDEPTSALDPIASASVEDLIVDLRTRITILIVTHNMRQAARVSDYTAYMYGGEIIEFGSTRKLFVRPKRRETEDYITGRFG